MSNAVSRMDEALPPVIVTPFEMLNNAIAKGATPETLTQLMALHERWEANNARKAFDNAMADAKAEIPVIQKNREVDFTSAKGRTNYRHEDLAEIARTVNPILAKHGLSYRYKTSSAPSEPVTVTCIVSHRDGYSEETTLSAGRDDSGNKNSIQAVGSTLTYLQRMTLKAALGIAASDDDDGKSADRVETVNQEQADAIRDLLEEVGGNRKVFLNYFKVESVEQIPAKEYQRVIAALNAKRK